jgi:hypothetical protein
MDALALLCTIHADGPATLARLRAGGVATLAEVAACDESRLAALLCASASAARRFQREAAGMSARLSAEELPAPARRQRARRPLSSKLDKPSAPAPAPRVEPGAAPTASTPPERELRQVLERWRDLDAVGEFADEKPRAARAEPARAPELAVGELDGLDERTVELLLGAGAGTLELLAACDPLALSARSGLGYSALVRLRALAARAARERALRSPPEPRAVDRGPEPRVVAPPIGVHVLQPMPRAERLEQSAASSDTAGGPFA